jgi:hypothetical protein
MSQGEDGQDGIEQPEIVWVGEQWRMDGYCGRVVMPASSVPEVDAANDALRPIAVVKTRPRQAKVVRIGPPRMEAA